MRRVAAVGGDHRPLVRQRFDVVPAGIHHGLDRETHPGAKPRIAACLNVVRHRRILVKRTADAVAYEITNHGVTVTLRVRLHRVADVGHVIAWLHRLDTL